MANLYLNRTFFWSFLILVLGLCVPSYGQSDGQESTGNAKVSMPGNSGKTGATVSLGGIPVNLYTGAASPAMSLYTLPSRSLSLPVSLVYTAGNGVQALSQASEVGTGWRLSLGGEISCEVRGAPDELATSDKGWLVDLANHPSSARWLQDKLCAGEDSEYDLYHANAMGLQVDFVVRGPSYEVVVLNERNVTVTPQFASWGNQRRIYAFTIVDANGTQYLFDNTNETRIHTQTRVNETGQLWPASDVTYISNWQLTRVTSLTGDNIYLTYNVENATPVIYKTYVNRGNVLRCDIYGNNCTTSGHRIDRASDGSYGSTATIRQGNSDYETTVTVTQSYVHRLSMIYAESGHIELIRGRHARRDKPGEYALSEIKVTDRNYQVVKRFLFEYGYFGGSSTDPDVLRLKLTKVKEAAVGCPSTTTEFSYLETTGTSRLNAPRDYWGYFTTANQPLIIPPPPPVPGTRNDNPQWPARTPDATCMQNCLLRRISSSTGSSTELEFEPHLDKRGVRIGGVRLKKVTVKDGFKASADQIFEISYTVFDRNNPSTVGSPSSENVYPPLFEENQRVRFPGGSICDPADDKIHTYKFSSSDPLEPIAPDYIGYKWASVKYPNGSRSAFKFTNQADYPDQLNTNSIKLYTNSYDDGDACHDQQASLPPFGIGVCNDPYSPVVRGLYTTMPQAERPYGVLNSAAHRRGILLEQIDVDSQNRLASIVENTYDFSQRDVAFRSATVAKEHQVFALNVFNHYYNIKFSDLERAWVPLQQQLVTKYDQRRGNAQAIGQMQQLTTYGYSNYMVSTTQVSNPAEGSQYMTRLTRVADYAPAPIYFPGNWPTFPAGVGEMYYGHSWATVVSTEQYIKTVPTASWQLTALAENEFLTRNSKPLLKRTISYDYVAGGQQPIGQKSVNDVGYDDKNNLVNILNNNGKWTGVVWGYGKLLPIASIDNGRASILTNGVQEPATAGHTSFENYDDDDWSYGNVYTQEAKTGTQSVLLSTPNSIYGPGKTFEIPAADQHGKYSFSCWAKVPLNESGYSNLTMVTVVTTSNGTSIWRGTGTFVNNTQEWQLCKGLVDLDEPAIKSALVSGQSIRIQCYPWIAWGQGNLLVDEMRFHHENARMTTTTYQQFVGKTSSTDENQVTTYFIYDSNNQLRLIKDDKGNIVKRIISHFATPNELAVSVSKTDGNLSPGTSATFTALTADCIDGVNYTWNFGDGSSQKGGSQQTHAYAQNGTYQLTVVAEAIGANPVEATIAVRVTDAIQVSPTYYGSTYFDLCSPSLGDNYAGIMAVPTGGCGSYTYRWETNEYQQWSGTWLGWVDAGNTTDTYRYYHAGPRRIQVRCFVTDSCGNITEYDDGFVTEASTPNCGLYEQKASSSYTK